MPELELMRLVRNGNSTQVTIPRPYLDALGWHAGECVLLVFNPDRTLTIQRVSGRELAILRERQLEESHAAAVLP